MNFKTRAEQIMYEALTEIAKNTPSESYNSEYDIYEECPHCDDMIYVAKEALKKVDELDETNEDKATCRTCAKFCPICKRCNVLNDRLKHIDEEKDIQCYFYKPKQKEN